MDSPCQSPCQAASSSSAGMEKLQVLKEFAAAEGKDGVWTSELKGLSPQDVYDKSLPSGEIACEECSGRTVARCRNCDHALLALFVEPIRGARGGGLG